MDENCYDLQDTADYLQKIFKGKSDVPSDVPSDEVWSEPNKHPIFPSAGFKGRIKGILKSSCNDQVSTGYISFSNEGQFMMNVKGYIQKKTMLYKTGVEYGDYTMNHIQGCAHGCRYPCYAFMMKKRFGQIKSYDNWLEPYIVSNTLDLLDKEIPKLRDKIESVHLCFSTDPFMYHYPEIQQLSLQAINKLNSAGIKCTVLTKGFLPPELTKCSGKNEYGITLVSLDEKFRKRIEPNSAPYKERLENLRALHDAGCYTWVSIEPYPTPNIINQNLTELLEAAGFVDKIIFGRMNYNKEVTAYTEHKQFFNDCAAAVTDFCEKHRINCHIKKGTVTL